MSIDHYIFNGSLIEEVITSQETILSDLQGILSKAKALEKRIKNYDGWKGKQKEELLTFLEILVAYQADLTGEKAAKAKGTTPYQKYIKSFKDLRRNVEDFPNQSGAYKGLRNK